MITTAFDKNEHVTIDKILSSFLHLTSGQWTISELAKVAFPANITIMIMVIDRIFSMLCQCQHVIVSVILPFSKKPGAKFLKLS